MKNISRIACLCAVWLAACTPTQQAVAPIPYSEAELISLGPYPDRYYNLASEFSNEGEAAKAAENYRLCIATTRNQAIRSDAMYNLSVLLFEGGDLSGGLVWFDSLLARKYTWLGWYKGLKGDFTQEKAFQDRLAQVDALRARRSDPAYCTFHFEDVQRFTAAYETARTDWTQAPAVFARDYFGQASPALFFYQKFKIQSSAHRFAWRVQQREAYFTSILPELKALPELEAPLRQYLERFKELYPEAVFPDVHFVVGCFNAGGTTYPGGLIIGAEMSCLRADSPLDNFSAWERAVVRGAENLPYITIHELVHMQQNDNYNNLLGNAIFEGAADFVCELVCGRHINEHVHAWARGREAQIKAEFVAEMYSENASNWIGNADRAVGKPADLGYYVGYQICKAYYDRQTDKTQAVKDILTITDWEDFYRRSGWE